MSTLSELQAAKTAIKVAEFLGADALILAIEDALRPPAPVGTPSVISDTADRYTRAAQDAEVVSRDLGAVARKALPAAWHGEAAETAAQAVDALGSEVQGTVGVLQRAAGALAKWAQDLTRAQTGDLEGCETLISAGKSLGFLGLEVWRIPAAASQALDGVQGRIDAARLAEDSGTRTASLLNQLTSKARAEHVTASGIDALSAVVLANDSDPGGEVDGRLILSENALARGSAQLDAMSPTDRAEFEKLLGQAKSPEETAYLWKALGAGHSLADLETFYSAIHPHGDDPAWLAGHLTPDMNDTDESNNQNYLTYQGQSFKDSGYGLDIYDQGSMNDCVAASTVIASANVDPTVMLKLTTGGTANGDDSPDAFHQRLQDMYTKQYIAGQRADGVTNVYPVDTTGLYSKGENLIANQDLSGTTGSGYHYVGLSSTSDRQDALPGIEKSVDSGRPVPIDVQGGKEGHQMMIIGRDGDRLEIYNPWGYTTWVSESQFVNNQLAGVTTLPGYPSILKTADGLELPN